MWGTPRLRTTGLQKVAFAALAALVLLAGLGVLDGGPL